MASSSADCHFESKRCLREIGPKPKASPGTRLFCSLPTRYNMRNYCFAKDCEGQKTIHSKLSDASPASSSNIFSFFSSWINLMSSYLLLMTQRNILEKTSHRNSKDNVVIVAGRQNLYLRSRTNAKSWNINSVSQFAGGIGTNNCA